MSNRASRHRLTGRRAPRAAGLGCRPRRAIRLGSPCQLRRQPWACRLDGHGGGVACRHQPREASPRRGCRRVWHRVAVPCSVDRRGRRCDAGLPVAMSAGPAWAGACRGGMSTSVDPGSVGASWSVDEAADRRRVVVRGVAGAVASRVGSPRCVKRLGATRIREARDGTGMSSRHAYSALATSSVTHRCGPTRPVGRRVMAGRRFRRDVDGAPPGRGSTGRASSPCTASHRDVTLHSDVLGLPGSVGTRYSWQGRPLTCDVNDGSPGSRWPAVRGRTHVTWEGTRCRAPGSTRLSTPSGMG